MRAALCVLLGAYVVSPSSDRPIRQAPARTTRLIPADQASGSQRSQPARSAAPDQEESEPVGPTDTRDERPSQHDMERAENRARRDGSVRVVVGLPMVFTPEGELSEEEVTEQRRTIDRERAELERDLDGSGHRRVRTFESVPYVALELPEQAVERLRTSDHAASVRIDELRRPSLEQSAPLVQADQMWSATYTGAGQTVAILDTGVAKTHSFFGGRVVEEACFSTTYEPFGATTLCPNGQESQTGAGSGVNCNTAITNCDHGTHVAGIAAGSGTTFSGVARGAGIMAVQVFSRIDDADLCSPGPSPCVLAFDSDYMFALERVHALRATRTFSSVNLSFGGGKHTSPCDASLGSAKALIDNLASVNIATVIASGNEGHSDGVWAPSCISTAITVGSTTKSNTVSSFSNTHPTMVDLMAPGSSITSSVPGGTFAVKSGTSMATPHVTGAWALIRSKSPVISVASALNNLKTTGLLVTDSGPGGTFTLPRIRIFTAAFNGVPGLATLFAPSGDISLTRPEFSWSTVASATTYVIRVMGPSGLLLDAALPASSFCDTTTCAAVPNDDLELGSYSWTIRARNSSGDGETSPPLDFTIVTPGLPIPISPSGDEASTTPAYQWQAVSGTESYQVLVVGPSGSTVVDTLATAAAAGCSGGSGTCQLAPSVALDAGAHKWWVRARDSSGVFGAWSGAESFTVVSNPAVPSLIAPSGGNVSPTPTFSWSAVADGSEYELHVIDPGGTTIIDTVHSATAVGCGGGSGTCQIASGTTLSAGTHQWRVRARGPTGAFGAWSAFMSFTVGDVPATPTQISPSGSGASNTPDFRWNNVSAATEYQLMVVGPSGAVVVNTTTSASSAGCGSGVCQLASPVPLATGEHRWWVRARNAAGTFGSWSDGMAFSVQ